MILPLSLSRYEVRTDLFLLGTQLEDLIEQFNTPPSVTDEVQTGASESLDSFECQSDETVGDEMIELFDELSQLQEVVEKIEADMEKLAPATSTRSHFPATSQLSQLRWSWPVLTVRWRA